MIEIDLAAEVDMEVDTMIEMLIEQRADASSAKKEDTLQEIVITYLYFKIL